MSVEYEKKDGLTPKELARFLAILVGCSVVFVGLLYAVIVTSGNFYTNMEEVGSELVLWGVATGVSLTALFFLLYSMIEYMRVSYTWTTLTTGR